LAQTMQVGPCIPVGTPLNKRLPLAQLLGQLGVLLTSVSTPPSGQKQTTATPPGSSFSHLAAGGIKVIVTHPCILCTDNHEGNIRVARQ
jgi:hypothetical protein